MASTKEMYTKDGRRFFKISVSRGYGKTPYTTRWYVPKGYTSKRAIEKGLKDAVADFERRCEAGEVLTRAERKEKERQAQIEAEKLKTVRQYSESVFMPVKTVEVSENTRANYQMFLDKHILPVIGDHLITEVSPAMIRNLLVSFQASGKSHASVTKMYNVLHGLFDMAFNDDVIPVSPMLKVKKPAPRKDEKTTPESEKSLSIEMRDQVLAWAEAEPLKWRTFIFLATDTGARRGELCGLKWSDISWKDGWIGIKRNLQYSPKRGVYVTSPKNGKSCLVDVSPDVIQLLKQLREEQAQKCMSVWVFTQDGSTEPMFPQSPTRYFKNFGDKHGLKNFHPHLLRHTSVSLAVTSGKTDLASVAARHGHSEAVVLKKYAHASKDSIRRAGDAARNAKSVKSEEKQA